MRWQPYCGMNGRNTVAKIDLSAIQHNFNEVKNWVDPSVRVCAVIKADAYGHGAITVARALITQGANWFAVATGDEALALREAGITEPILVMGEVTDVVIPILAAQDVRVALTSTARAAQMAALLPSNQKLLVHLKIDTGMGRIGFGLRDDDPGTWNEVLQQLISVYDIPQLQVEGIFTHFARADQEDRTYTLEQGNRFHKLVKEMTKRGYDVGIRHACNSAGLFEYPAFHFDMVRPGIMLYGAYPSPLRVRDFKRLNLQQAMTLQSELAFTKKVESGTGISYSHRFVTVAKTKIGSIPIGYGDGLSRRLSGKCSVLINGSRRRQVGTICMDQCLVELSSKDKVGDEVVFFGKQGEEFISIEEYAALVGTISYEIFCMVGKRVPRIYISSE